MQDIDSLDLIAYIQLQAWRAQKLIEPRPAAIDEVWPWLFGPD